MIQRQSKPQVLVIGASPPPHNGMSVATELVLAALRRDLPVIHLDTADRRGLSNIGKFELGNLMLATVHGAKCLWFLLAKRPPIVYVPISQAWLPFLRDCLFLVPARLLRRKVVVHLHGGYFGRFYRETSPPMRRIVRYTLGKTSRAIVLGKNVAGVFDSILPASRARIVPNGIPDYFENRLAGQEEVHSPPVLLYLSTLSAEKGALDLLRVLPRVKRSVGGVRAILAGEWYSQRDKIAAEHLVDRLGLRTSVEFTGPVEPARKRELLELGDVFTLPTKNEGHPYAILEAMSAGLPIISTKVGCIPETVRDGVEGFLIEPGDVEGLAERICALLSDDALRRRMGEASRERFLREFTFEKYAQRMRAVFAEVLEEGQANHRHDQYEPPKGGGTAA